MKLENQLATVEQSKRLRELGIVQEGNYTWIWNPSGNTYDISPLKVEALELLAKSHPKSKEWAERKEKGIFSAFSVAELGTIIPDYTRKLGNLEIGKSETDHISMKPQKTHWHCSYWTWGNKYTKSGDIYLEKVSSHVKHGDTIAQCLANMAIYLIEKELITPEEANKRLIES